MFGIPYVYTQSRILKVWRWGCGERLVGVARGWARISIL